MKDGLHFIEEFKKLMQDLYVAPCTSRLYWFLGGKSAVNGKVTTINEIEYEETQSIILNCEKLHIFKFLEERADGILNRIDSVVLYNSSEEKIYYF